MLDHEDLPFGTGHPRKREGVQADSRADLQHYRAGRDQAPENLDLRLQVLAVMVDGTGQRIRSVNELKHAEAGTACSGNSWPPRERLA